MARVIHLRLQGKAEHLVNELIGQGLTEQDIISRALWLFDQAITTKRIAMVDSSGRLQYHFGLETTMDEPRDARAVLEAKREAEQDLAALNTEE